MNSLDLLVMSYHNLMRRKARAILTTLGVVIGTASIIIMLSLGIAMNQNFKQSLSQMGNLNVIDVYPNYQGPGNEQPTNTVKLDDNAVADFQKIPGVDSVMAQENAGLKMVVGKMVGYVNIVGVDPEVLEHFDFKTEKGRLLLDSDKNVLLFGCQVANNFYNPRSRNRDNGMGGMMDQSAVKKLNTQFLKEKLLISSDSNLGEPSSAITDDPSYKPLKPYEAKGIGLLKQSNDEKDYSVYMNVNALEKIVKADQRQMPNQRIRGQQQDKYMNIKVKAADATNITAIQKQIQNMGYQASSLADSMEQMKKASRTVMIILGIIGAVSLLVAAIGIANTMMMSIYERTREIGIIKVLGAEITDIKKMFLAEAAMIGFGGGMIGMGLSLGLSLILNKGAAGFMSSIGGAGPVSKIPAVLALSAVAFAMLVGLISGYIPAKRAMNLSVLEAIRSE